MKELPKALWAFAAFPQFILFKTVPSQTRQGKAEKLPIDYRTGRTANAHDPAIWLDCQAAIATAAAWGDPFGVGFVFTEADPFWFIDIDNCLTPTGWASHAVRLCELLAGCAVEVSKSGAGLHLFGRGRPPAHECRNSALGIEFYHAGRFAALTGDRAQGSAALDFNHVLPALVTTYFPPDLSQSGQMEWTSGPCAEWSGIKDDSELIRAALASRTVASTFGNKASFADLWFADERELAKAFPDEGRPYNESQADGSLAQHLAFWTGKDCERILRLMRMSKLVRDKWEREDYLPRTISGAVARQSEVFGEEAARRREQIERSVQIGEGADETRIVGTLSLDEMLTQFVFIQDGQQVVNLQQPQHVATLADWKATLKASTTTLEVKGQFNYDGTPKTKTYETATLWEKNPKRKVAHVVTFKAGGKLLTLDPKRREAINIWTPFDRSIQPGDASLFLEHVDYLFRSDAGRFLDWLTHIEQKPGELPHSGWVHISDKHGTGRNWLAGLIARLWPGYAAINFDLSGTLRNGFNDRLSRKLIAVVDEIQEGGSNAK